MVMLAVVIDRGGDAWVDLHGEQLTALHRFLDADVPEETDGWCIGRVLGAVDWISSGRTKSGCPQSTDRPKRPP
jgi:hypothetical protein